MAEDWAADVKKYAPGADDNVIAGLVRYCGIALQKRDSSLVAFSDSKETDRVRENFLKKKLARTESDAALDAEIAAVGQAMKEDRTKNRVTVYYLLADKFDSLHLFLKASNAKAKAPAKASGAAAGKPAPAAAPKTKPAAKPAVKAAAAAGGAALGLAAIGGESSGGAPAATDAGAAAKATAALGAAGAAVTGAASAAADTAGNVAGAAADTAGNVGAAVVGAAGAAALGAAALAGKAGDAAAGAVGTVGGAASSAVGAVTGGVGRLVGGDDEDSSSWLWWLLAGLLALFAIWWFFLRGPDGDDAALPAATQEAAVAASGTADMAAAPAEGSVAIPAGAGVTSEMREGKPVVKVYFDSGKTNVVPDFVAAAGGLKAYLSSHAGSSLAVTGYADPTGNAARNAELSKRRAQAVKAALVAAGVPDASAEMVKPADSTDATVDKAAARRVEVVVR